MVNFLRVVQLGVTTLLFGAVAMANPFHQPGPYRSTELADNGYGSSASSGSSYGSGLSGGLHRSGAVRESFSRPFSSVKAKHIMDSTPGVIALKQAHRDASRAHGEAHLSHLEAQRAHSKAALHFAAHGDHESARLHRAAALSHGRKAAFHNDKSSFHRSAAHRVFGSDSAALHRARLSANGARLSKGRGDRSFAHAGAAKAHLDAAAAHDKAGLAHYRAGNHGMAELHFQHADSHRMTAALHGPGNHARPDAALSTSHAESSHRMATHSLSSVSRHGRL